MEITRLGYYEPNSTWRLSYVNNMTRIEGAYEAELADSQIADIVSIFLTTFFILLDDIYHPIIPVYN